MRFPKDVNSLADGTGMLDPLLHRNLIPAAISEADHARYDYRKLVAFHSVSIVDVSVR